MIDFEQTDKAFDFNLTADEKAAINEAVATAASNGSDQTLILTDTQALIISVKSEKILNVLNRDDLSRGISTKVDSVVVIK